jgi:hypothetical protein
LAIEGKAICVLVGALLLGGQAPKGWGFQEDCQRRGEPKVGMHWQQVYDTCWGKPSKINTTQTLSGTSDQLVYPRGNYIYLTDGIVTAIQTSR